MFYHWAFLNSGVYVFLRAGFLNCSTKAFPYYAPDVNPVQVQKFLPLLDSPGIGHDSVDADSEFLGRFLHHKALAKKLAYLFSSLGGWLCRTHNDMSIIEQV